MRDIRGVEHLFVWADFGPSDHIKPKQKGLTTQTKAPVYYILIIVTKEGITFIVYLHHLEKHGVRCKNYFQYTPGISLAEKQFGSFILLFSFFLSLFLTVERPKQGGPDNIC